MHKNTPVQIIILFVFTISGFFLGRSTIGPPPPSLHQESRAVIQPFSESEFTQELDLSVPKDSQVQKQLVDILTPESQETPEDVPAEKDFVIEMRTQALSASGALTEEEGRSIATKLPSSPKASDIKAALIESFGEKRGAESFASLEAQYNQIEKESLISEAAVLASRYKLAPESIATITTLLSKVQSDLKHEQDALHQRAQELVAQMKDGKDGEVLDAGHQEMVGMDEELNAKKELLIQEALRKQFSGISIPDKKTKAIDNEGVSWTIKNWFER